MPPSPVRSWAGSGSCSRYGSSKRRVIRWALSSPLCSGRSASREARAAVHRRGSLPPPHRGGAALLAAHRRYLLPEPVVDADRAPASTAVTGRRRLRDRVGPGAEAAHRHPAAPPDCLARIIAGRGGRPSGRRHAPPAAGGVHQLAAAALYGRATRSPLPGTPLPPRAAPLAPLPRHGRRVGVPL